MPNKRPSTFMKFMSVVVPIFLLGFFASACGGGGSSATAAGDDKGPAQHGGEIILGMDQEPPCINTAVVCGGMAVASNMSAPMWDSMLVTTNEGKRIPWLAEEVPSTENGLVVVNGKGMDVTINIKKEAHWSDGKPITCEDSKFTWETMMNDKWLISSRLGWDKISSVECPTPNKVIYHFKETYAPFLLVVGAAPFPKHDIDGKDFNTYLNDKAPVTSGPYRLKHWKRNVEYVLERNPDWWAKGKNDYPYLDRIIYRFLKDTNTLKIQLRTGEVDLIMPPPDTTLKEELDSFPRAEYQMVPGGYWENFAFQTEQWPVDDVDVRKAIAYSIDRKQLTEVVLQGQTTVLDSTLMPQLEQYYTPAWKDYSYDEAKVQEHLEKAGFKRNGQYYEKGGKTLEVLFKTTAGNQLRAKVAQLLQQTFKKNGIKMEVMLEDPGVFFGQSAPTGAYTVAEWAWGSGIDPTQTSLFHCDQIPTEKNQMEGNNNYRWCDKEVSELLVKADAEPDVKKRGAYLKEAQKGMAEGMPLLPLYQRPETMAYAYNLNNIKNNPFGSQLWNIHEWWVSAE